MGDAVSKAQLLAGCCGVTAADDGDGVGVSQSLSHGDGTLGQSGVLKHAHGAVPDHGLGIADSLSKDSGGLFADVQAFLAVGDGIDGNSLNLYGAVDGGGEAVCDDAVNGQQQLDTLIIGGGMAFTFLASQGYGVGKSLLDDTKLDYCRDMMKKAEQNGVKLLLPIDTAVADSFPDPIDGAIDVDYVPSSEIPADKEGLDIGPKTAKLFADAVMSAKTVVWNGPMGVFENPTLAKGTIAVAEALAASDATTIVGGGDSAAACEQLGFAPKITHISTGGGASLEFLEGKDLPGVSCLLDK